MNFLAVSKKFSSLESAKSVILGFPYEISTSYHTGCANGPKNLIEASESVELFDAELKVIPHRSGIYTKIYKTDQFSMNHEENLNFIGSEFLKFYKLGKFVVSVGGEHSISVGLINSLLKHDDEISVLQFDAHADLRNYYQGRYDGHASTMRRVYDKTSKVAQLGIRSYSSQEWNYMKSKKPLIIHANELHELSVVEVIEKLSSILTSKVYITFDVDYFSTEVVQDTGTPEPGGLGWYKTLEILRAVFEKYNIVAMDVVELDGSNDRYSSFNTALLVKKCITYKHFLN